MKEQKPDDENLQRQSTLVHNALITTIDSFCLFVVQNNFAQLDLDPDFRIGDQAELKLMLKDALAQVFEDNYAREDNEAFINLIDTYSKGEMTLPSGRWWRISTIRRGAHHGRESG